MEKSTLLKLNLLFKGVLRDITGDSLYKYGVDGNSEGFWEEIEELLDNNSSEDIQKALFELSAFQKNIQKGLEFITDATKDILFERE